MTANHVDVLIVGAGLSGIGTACQITGAFPQKSIAVIERRERIGGTWDLFRYPGVRSDSDMFTFGYEWRPWTDTEVLAPGDSIREYIAETAAAYGIDEKVHHGLKILSADWSRADCRWTVTALHEASGQERVFTCGFLVNCAGYYNYDAGHLPEFPGADHFGGQTVHPQFWPENFDYADKRVVVVGSGATAVTLVPSMAEKAAHVTMLQRSPSYVMSVPAEDKISPFLDKFLPSSVVFWLARKRNIGIQRGLYLACGRWPTMMRRFLLSQVKRRVGPEFDMAHFTPTYKPWDERLCAVPNGDLFKVLASGDASVVTDTIETFTETGIRLTSGRELDADVIVTATGLDVKVMGGITFTVDGEVREVRNQMTYKAVMVQNLPNLAWVFGYTNAPWTLKSDLVAKYLVRLFTHMETSGHSVVMPVDHHDSALDDGIMDSLQSGYVQRAKDKLPRQGKDGAWRVLMHYGHDTRMLLDDPIDDGLLEFSGPVLADAMA
ncbi:FAD-containing monooxygenase EthA [Aeromicrobium sp. Root344]|uniref:flavin-containing monooxygenase n=1 Tax=Aeromicrobium sp. Root344 TaxID=1736521 RepID=UPI0006FFC90D|nr:NAD(P)/FAD-dependent oxidoreductase [Aeromicrobium sp. Root344]KQV74762.1 FAD-containing monooxygenase EthA [Aeromicrobium sp. Root344]